MRDPILIVNPASGGGSGARRREMVERAARKRWPALSLRLTAAPGDAERFAREWGASDSEAPILALGGDGTVHEVLNGMAANGFASPLGIIPAGTGNDFVRNGGAEFDLEAGSPREVRGIDVGRIRFTTPVGESATRIFANAASIGIVPRANRIAHRIRRGLPGKFCYRLGGLAALLNGRALQYRVTTAGAVLHDGPALSLTFANGARFGGGMRISPGSRTDDGTLELVAIGAIGLPRALLALVKVEQGGHLELRGVMQTRLTAPARVEGPAGELLLEADGQEFVAIGAVEVEVLPGVLTLLG